MSKEIVKKPTSTLIVEKGKYKKASGVGHYSHKATAQLAKNKAGKIISIGEITKMQYGQKAREGSHTEQYVRSKLTIAVNLLLEAGIPAIPIYDKESPHHKKIGIKVVAEYDKEDFEKLNAYKKAAEDRGDISHERAVMVAKAMEKLKPPTTEEPPNADQCVS